MKKICIFILIIIIILSVAACTSQKVELTETDQGKKEQLYILVAALGNSDYFHDLKVGLEKVGEDLGVRAEYVGPAEYDMSAMSLAFERAIAKKPNGIVVVGFEASLNPMIRKAIEMSIPVITVDSDLSDSGRITYVGTDNFNAGKIGGEKLVELIGGKGKVAIMTKIGQSNLEERIEGYKSVFEQYQGIEIVQVIDTNSDPIIAARAATLLLQKHPDLAGIACVEAAGSVGVATEVRDAGMGGKIKIVAMDRGKQVLREIEDGVISATVVQQTALMPYYAVQVLYNLNNSYLTITTNNIAAGVSGVPSSIDTGVIIVDKSNYKYFIR